VAPEQAGPCGLRRRPVEPGSKTVGDAGLAPEVTDVAVDMNPYTHNTNIYGVMGFPKA
jgi:hypothetical protein